MNISKNLIKSRILSCYGVWCNLGQVRSAWIVKDTYLDDFELMDNSKKHENDNSRHALHGMVYARMNQKTFSIQRPRGCFLMQMRFDGYLGFPGGLVDPGEDPIEGLNRELQEEMNLDLTKHKVTEKDHICSQHSKSRNLTLHFYALETSLPELKKIEQNAILAKDFGSEVLGIIRVPLYIMQDGFRGFPAFLTNAFIGSSKQQLLHTLEHLKLMTAQEISEALAARPHRSPKLSDP